MDRAGSFPDDGDGNQITRKASVHRVPHTYNTVSLLCIVGQDVRLRNIAVLVRRWIELFCETNKAISAFPRPELHLHEIDMDYLDQTKSLICDSNYVSTQKRSMYIRLWHPRRFCCAGGATGDNLMRVFCISMVIYLPMGMMTALLYIWSNHMLGKQ
jgi:hypothetical protein